jgi:hypothetical protein
VLDTQNDNHFCFISGLKTMLLDTRMPTVSVIGERDLRRQIDRSVSRALVDGEYARLLLTDPTVVLEDRGCPPQQYKSLRSITASNLVDFAQQAQALFWAVEPVHYQKPLDQEDQLPLVAAR